MFFIKSTQYLFKIVTAGKLKDGVAELTPIITGNGPKGKLQLNVSRVHLDTDSNENNTKSSDLPRLWAYLAVQVKN